MFELEASELNLQTQNVSEILGISKKLLYLCLTVKWGQGSQLPAHEQYIIQNTMKATKGRTVVGSTYLGLYPVNLSPWHQRNRDKSMKMIEKAWQQSRDPMIHHRWDNIVS